MEQLNFSTIWSISICELGSFLRLREQLTLFRCPQIEAPTRSRLQEADRKQLFSVFSVRGVGRSKLCPCHGFIFGCWWAHGAIELFHYLEYINL
jgi:hypothetical protein